MSRAGAGVCERRSHPTPATPTTRPASTALESLRCLSLGNNHLASPDDVHEALRPLSRLEALTLCGNPLVAAAGGPGPYRHRVVALLPRLRYLDHELVTAAQVCLEEEELGRTRTL